MLLYSGLHSAKWWTAVTVAACGLILLNNTIYFQGGVSSRFLLEKGELTRSSWWIVAFYFHVVGASICLVAGTPLMFADWTRSHPVWHRLLGYVYLNAVLWMAAPSGIALAITAKGGLWGTIGFAVAGTFWWGTTWSGYRAIRRGESTSHICAMIRSYSWALSAPVFRAIQAVLTLLGLEDTSNYIVSLWLSIAASIWLAESYLYRSRRGAMQFVTNPAAKAGVMS
jgi:hypothetical protein